MSKDPKKTPSTLPVLEFKSSTFFVPILILFSNDLAIIEHALHEKINLAPEFFRNSSLIVDVRELNKQGYELDIVAITEMLRKIDLFPTGVRGGNEQQNKQAHSLFIPIDAIRDNDGTAVLGTNQKQAVNTQSSESEIEFAAETLTAAEAVTVAEAVKVAKPSSTSVAATLITQPIRSGQRIYASGDLVIMSQVSAGAEIMAEGNIHVYNTLRGRALAGVQGNIDARIFCLDLQAELVSIAGDYKTSEDLSKIMHKKPVQIYLQDHALIIKEIA